MDQTASVADSGIAQHGWSTARQLRTLVIATALAGVVGLAVWGIGQVGIKKDEPGAGPSPTASPDAFRATPAQLADLKMQPVARMAFRTEQVTEGKIALNGNRTTQVFSPYSGRVVRVLVEPGEEVREGEPLLAIAASEFVQGQNDLNTALAQVTLATSNLERKQGLYETKGGSLQDVQQARADLIAAQNGLASARNRLRILGKTDQQIGAMEQAGTIDPIAYVLAPIGGVVTDRQIGPGQNVQAGGAVPVYTIGDLSTVWLVGNVREDQAPFVRRGQAVEVRVTALPGRVFDAKLTYVAPAVDPATRRLQVHAQIPNPDGALKPEMFATFTIATGEESQAPAVPAGALIYEGETARVWIAGPHDTLQLRPVRLGRSKAGMVEILSGVTVGENVVTQGSLFIDRAARVD